MKNYVVVYTEAEVVAWQCFHCEADDVEHAEEQCDNSYPGCDIVGVYAGATMDDALAAMNAEMGWTEEA